MLINPQWSFELIKLIGKSDARYDVVKLIEDHIGVTVGYLDSIIDRTDRAIRTFLDQLLDINYIECFDYKYQGRWITIFAKKGCKFDIHEVIKRHVAARRKKKVYLPVTVKFIGDIPFEFQEQDLILVAFNKELGIKRDILKSKGENCLIKQLEKAIEQIRFKNPNKLENYLVFKDG